MIDLLILAIIVTFFGAIVIDNRWWWFITIIVILGFAAYYGYKDTINHDLVIKSRVYTILGWITFYAFLYTLICSIFISALWLFMLIVVFILMGALGSFGIILENKLSNNEKSNIAKTSTACFLALFCLFCIPSFIANTHKNPVGSFSLQYRAVESYNIYGEGPTNTEHIIARSWYSVNNYDNDYVNIIKSLEAANSARGNLKFGRVSKTENHAIYYQGSIIGYKDDSHFMPTDEYKGDVARIVLYMYITYKDDGLKKEYINVGLMKTWSRQDPVDGRERLRNKTIQTEHGYSNKLVAFPWLVGFIV